MDTPPPEMLEGLDDAERHRTTTWWSTLNAEAKAEFVQLWDARADDTALYGTTVDGRLTWHELPIELRGALIDEENDREHKELKSQLREYISNHEDIQFFLVDKRFHICSAHAAARAVIRDGVLPRSFVCPVNPATCPMHNILQACPGRSVALTVQLKTSAPR